MSISVKYTEFLRALNGIKGDYSKLDAMYDNFDNVKNEDWYKQSKSFINLNGMSDSELSTSQPIVTGNLECIRQWIYDSQSATGTDRNYSEIDPSKFGITNNFLPPVVYYTKNTPIEIKPTSPIGDFDRVCYYVDFGENVEVRQDTSFIGNPIYGIEINDDCIFYCKKIKNNNIETVELNTSIGEIDFITYNNVWLNRFDIARTWVNHDAKNNSFKNMLWQFCYTTNCDGNLSSNVWIFKSESDADNYLVTGRYERALNYHEDYEPETETDDGCDNKMLYWRQHVWSKNSNKGAKSYVDDLSFEIEIDISNRAYKPIAMKNRVTLNQIQDTEININNSDDILGIRYKNYNDEWTIKPLQFLYNLEYVYRRTRNIIGGQYNNKVLGCDLSTNIPVFFKDGDIDKFFNNEIDEDSAINSDDLHVDSNPNGNGDKITSELNEINTANNLSQILELSTSFLSEFSTFLSNDTELESVLGGLKLRGNNPISFIVDLFALPFSIDYFVTKQSENRMFFGSYDKTFNNSFNKIVRTNILKNVFNTFISPTYNDWRDYMCNVYIYLPYVNIQPLDINEIMNKNLSCKVGVDVTTGSIKYYLFANGVMIKTIEGNVRQNLPMSATDYYGASMNKIGGASQVLSGAISVSSIGASFGSKAINNRQLAKKGLETQENNLNIGGIMGGVNNMFNGFNEIVKDPPKSVSGNYSSSSAFFDEINAYLIFERMNILYPQAITNKYNLPSNYYGKLGACHGYTEINNIDLIIDCDETIKENILAILNSGFYID